jgi:hypothetical protein
MFVEDLEFFFEDFGIEVTITRDAVLVVTSTLIHEAPMSEVNVYDRSFYDEKFYEARVQGSSVSLLGIAANLSDVQTGDVATVNAEPWYIIAKEPDGTGLMTLRLSGNSI